MASSTLVTLFIKSGVMPGRGGDEDWSEPCTRPILVGPQFFSPLFGYTHMLCPRCDSAWLAHPERGDGKEVCWLCGQVGDTVFPYLMMHQSTGVYLTRDCELPND